MTPVDQDGQRAIGKLPRFRTREENGRWRNSLAGASCLYCEDEVVAANRDWIRRRNHSLARRART